MKEVLTAQAVFDNVVAALAAQGGPSLASSLADDMGGIEGCAYRGDNGRKCAVGHLIRDDEYTLSMENQSVIGLLNRGQLPARLMPFADLLGLLQTAHDGASHVNNRWVNPWAMDDKAIVPRPLGLAARLVDVANTHGLDRASVMRAFPPFPGGDTGDAPATQAAAA